MTRIRLIVMALTAVFCISGIASASALAGSGELVTSSGGALGSFTGKSTETELVGASTIKCKTDSAAGKATSVTGGEETVTFTGCTALGLSCKNGKTTEGKEPVAGTIIVLVGLLVQKSAPSGFDNLLTEIIKQGSSSNVLEINCSGVKIWVKGSFLSSNIKLNELKKVWTFEAKASGKTQLPTKYKNSKGEEFSNTLESSTTSETSGFEASAEVGAEEVTFEKEAEFK